MIQICCIPAYVTFFSQLYTGICHFLVTCISRTFCASVFWFLLQTTRFHLYPFLYQPSTSVSTVYFCINHLLLYQPSTSVSNVYFCINGLLLYQRSTSLFIVNARFHHICARFRYSELGSHANNFLSNKF